MKQLFRSLRTNTKGAVAIEYALLVGLIAVALIVGMQVFSDSRNAMFDSVTDHISATNPS